MTDYKKIAEEWLEDHSFGLVDNDGVHNIVKSFADHLSTLEQEPQEEIEELGYTMGVTNRTSMYCPPSQDEVVSKINELVRSLNSLNVTWLCPQHHKDKHKIEHSCP